MKTVLGCDGSPPSWKVRPCTAEKRGGTERDFGGGQRSGRGMEIDDWRRFRRLLDDQEEDNKQIPGW